MANRPRKAKVEPSSLAKALTFATLGSRDEGLPYQSHVVLWNHWAVGFDGVVAAGHPILEDLEACPHSARFLDAVKRCSDDMSITQLDSGRLSIKSGSGFKAFVPCASFDIMMQVIPDEPIVAIGDEVKAALEVVAVLATEGATRVIMSSVLLRSGSAVGSDGTIMLEAWHGFELPTVVLPKAFVVALLKIDKPLVSFGCSATSVTFHFEDGAWLKSQIYLDPWPDVEGILNFPAYPVDVPPKLFEALEAIKGFTENNKVQFFEGKVKTHATEGVGAEYDVPNLSAGACFSVQLLLKIAAHVEQIDYTTHKDRAMFFKDNVRGVIMQMKP